MIDLILKNIRIPTLIFYITVPLLLTLVYRRELKLFFALLYSVCVVYFNSSFWEFLPSIANGTANINNTTTLSLYFIPLLLFVIFYNIKFSVNKKKIIFLFLTLFVSGFYFPILSLLHLSHYWYPISFVPRIVCLLALSWIFYPNVDKVRFGIARGRK
jgi:hypothetical protein